MRQNKKKLHFYIPLKGACLFLSYANAEAFHEEVSFSEGWPISIQCWIWYRNRSFELHCKSNDWFLNEMQHKAEMY